MPVGGGRRYPDQRFLEALPGHLPGDPASQMRRPILLKRLGQLADLG